MKNFFNYITMLLVGLFLSVSCSGNGKTVIPFSTHESSGLSNVVEDLKRLYPNANFKTAFSIYGHECRKDLSKVDKWLKGLGHEN